MQNRNIINTTIVMVQLVVIALIYVKLDAVERDVAAVKAAQHESVDPVVALAPALQAPARSAEDPQDEERLRRIIRQELSAQLQTQQQPGELPDPSIARAPADQADYEYQRDQVVRQIDYYRSIGSISQAQMQSLQSDIAYLDPQDRQRMLNRLVQAMNSGEIDGNL